jgi:hypothetical protein
MAAVCPVAASLSSPPLGRPTLTTQRRRGLNVYLFGSPPAAPPYEEKSYDSTGDQDQYRV